MIGKSISTPKKSNDELDDLVRKYQKRKSQKIITKILQLVDPLIRGRVNSLIFRLEKSNGWHVSDAEDMCQEMRIKVVSLIKRWIPSRGNFYSFVNVCITSHFKNLMLKKHRNFCNKVIDREISLDAKLYSSDVNSIRFVDIVSNGEIGQDRMMIVAELGRIVSEAVSVEISGTEYGFQIFSMLIAGHKASSIARKIRKRESFVRAFIRRAIKRIRFRIPSFYQRVYDELQSDLALVPIQISDAWY